MGETSGLPLPAGQPANPPQTAGATAPRQPVAATATSQPAAATADAGVPGNPLQLFDLLLGAAPAVASTLPRTATGKAGNATDDPTDAAAVADPLQLILAQVPQLQATAATLPVPATGVAGSPPATKLPATVPPAVAALTADAAAVVPTAALAARLQAAPMPVAPANADATAAVPALSVAVADALHAAAPELATTATTGKDVPLPMIAAAGDFRLPADTGTPAPTITALQALAGHHAAPTAAVTAPATAATILQQPADPATGYDDGFSGHIAWLAGQRIGHAEIRVVPEHLGVIDIRLHVDGSDVRADFHSSQPEVRQALEASLPRLREMLGQQGLQLAHAGVGQGQSQAQGQTQRDGQPQSGGFPVSEASDRLTLPGEAGSPLPPNFRKSRGLLDVYA